MKHIIIIALAALAEFASAAIEQQLYDNNQNTYFHDTTSGKDWMRLDQSDFAGKNLQDIFESLAGTSQYYDFSDGWELATASDLSDFIQNNHQSEDFVSIFGKDRGMIVYDQTQTNTGYSFEIVELIDGNQQGNATALQTTGVQGIGGFTDVFNIGGNGSEGGLFLVRHPGDTPSQDAPLSAGIVGLVLACGIASRRRRS